MKAIPLSMAVTAKFQMGKIVKMRLILMIRHTT